MAPDLARFVQELYALPPREFTRARDARAAGLRAAGRAAEARAVRELRRPSVALWAANQLAHAEPRRLEGFVRTVDGVRRAQLRDPRAASEALRRQRAELDLLVHRAGELLAEHGHRATLATERRVSDTLLGAAVDRRLSEDLRHGRLTAEQLPPGFEVLAGAAPASRLRLLRPGNDGPRRVGRPAGDSERERREPDAAGDRREAAAQAQAAERAERERRVREAEARRRQAADLVEAADRARRELRDLEARVTESRRRLREAQRVASRATAAARRSERRPSR
jgi:hypothetical protein